MTIWRGRIPNMDNNICSLNPVIFHQSKQSDDHVCHKASRDLSSRLPHMVTSVPCFNPVFLPSASTHFVQPQAVIKHLFGKEKKKSFNFWAKCLTTRRKVKEQNHSCLGSPLFLCHEMYQQGAQVSRNLYIWPFNREHWFNLASL